MPADQRKGPGTHVLEPVDSRHISVVIQGPLYRHADPEGGILACIASVRQALPQAEIIVSTWRDEDVSQLDVDRIVLLEDPGGLFDCAGNQINANRMLYSTAQGIQVATRPYVMKLRADHRLSSPALAVIGRSHHGNDQAARLFDTPITVTTLYIRNPKRVCMLFHLSDLVQFGTHAAMLDLWQQPPIPPHHLVNDRPYRNPFGHFMGYSSVRMVPEQAILLGAMHKKGIEVQLANPSQVSLSHLKLWDSLLRGNFNVLDHAKAGVVFPERFLGHGLPLKTLYTAADIDQLDSLDAAQYRQRMASIWLNKYVMSCLRPVWWLSLASLVLFNFSPRLARRLRSRWRRARNLVHADSYRV